MDRLKLYANFHLLTVKGTNGSSEINQAISSITHTIELDKKVQLKGSEWPKPFYFLFYRIRINNTCCNVDVSIAKPIIKNSKLRGVWKIVNCNEIEKDARQSFYDDWGSSNSLYVFVGLVHVPRQILFKIYTYDV